MSLLVGTAKIDITPTLCVPYLGTYPNRHAYFEGVHDPLYAKTIVLDDSQTVTAQITLDGLGFVPTFSSSYLFLLALHLPMFGHNNLHP